MKAKDKTPALLKIVRWFFPKLEIIAPFLARRYFIKIFFTPLKYGVPEKERAIENMAEKFSINVSGKRIQCYSWGKGPMILLVHGWAGRATQFRRFIEILTANDYRVVGFDGPAHGNSEGKQTNIIEFEQVLKVIFKDAGEPEAIIAHSFGGGAVLHAAMNGLPVKKLINIASPTIGDEIINTYLKAINGSPATGAYFKKWILHHYNKPFDEFTSLYFIEHLKNPVDLLLVHDEDDKEVILKHALQLKQRYPVARILVTKGLGHTRILKDDDVIEKCVTFIGNSRLPS